MSLHQVTSRSRGLLSGDELERGWRPIVQAATRSVWLHLVHASDPLRLHPVHASDGIC